MLLIGVSEENGVAHFAANASGRSEIYAREESCAGSDSAVRADGNGAAQYGTFLNVRPGRDIDGSGFCINHCPLNACTLLDEEE